MLTLYQVPEFKYNVLPISLFNMLLATRGGSGTWYSPCGSPSWVVHLPFWAWVLSFCSLFFPFLGALVHTWLAGFHHHFWSLIRPRRGLTQKGQGTTWVLAHPITHLLVAIFKPRNVKICTQGVPNSILGGDLYQGSNLEATKEIHGFYHGTSLGAGSPKVINRTPILGGKLMTPTLITRGCVTLWPCHLH